ncbi:MAG: N,N-dimethylformamidase beta subunit family domain-containing protein, partial [Deltaproteobacteria bacterium]
MGGRLRRWGWLASALVAGCGSKATPGSSVLGELRAEARAMERDWTFGRPLQLDPATAAYGRTPAPSPLAAENARPGDPSWVIAKESTDREIEGYASVESAEAGESVGFSVDAQPAGGQFDWTLYRLGWYGGALARKVASGGPLQAPAQKVCVVDGTTGLLECTWPATFAITIDPAWVSGAYLLKLHRVDSGLEKFVPLIVRDHRVADLVYVLPTNTWAAYNPWGGESLYEDQANVTPSGVAYRSSYDRPYGEGQGAEHLLWWQEPLIAFLERYGFDVTYGSNPDLSRFSGFLQGAGAVLGGGGHDEYWAQTERDQLDQGLSGGLFSLDYLGANGGYWRVRLEPAVHDGAPLRTVTCYKGEPQDDPLGATEPTTRFRDPPNPEPENALFGAMYLDWQLFGAPLRVTDPTSFVFAGTGMAKDDVVPGLVGYEFDGVVENGAQPEVDILSSSPVATAEGTPGASNMVVRTLPGGQLVFSAGSIYFTQGLVPNGPLSDPRLYRIVWNVLEQSLSWQRPTRPAPDFSSIPSPPAPTTFGHWGGAVTTVAGSGTPGDVDGPAAQAAFVGPA